ncbi:MAG TPA: polyprenyl synthetase family protein [Verrucomicrobiae bacterium]|nr:polyprenyl synthetase family protein [Verrucomicrobiae bacterium]
MGDFEALELPLLRERQARTMDYLQSADVQFSAVFERIMRHTFAYADPLCASLVLWACDACGGDSETAVPVAASVECLYRFSVLHDELQMAPTLSFERESTSSIWGLAQTLNAGDAFHALGLGLLAKDAVHSDRVLDVGLVLAHGVLHGVEQRNRLIRASARVGGERRLRVAYAGTHSSMLALSLRVGGMMAGASPQLADVLARAGRLLGAIMQLASQARGASSPAAARYAAKAVTLVEGSSLDPIYIAEFKEIAYELAAGR